MSEPPDLPKRAPESRAIYAHVAGEPGQCCICGDAKKALRVWDFQLRGRICKPCAGYLEAVVHPSLAAAELISPSPDLIEANP